MKFLLELISCCGCQEVSGDSSPVSERPSEVRSLVTAVRRNYRRKRSGRVGGGSYDVDNWKPSLSAISEERVVIYKQKSESERNNARRKSGGFHRDTVTVRRYSKDFWPNSTQTYLPGFSPTPFMF